MVAAGGGATSMPSPAEYIDTLRACDKLRIKPGSADWTHVVQMTLWKHGRARAEEEDEDESDE
jgi:hypothetical protein